MYARGIEEWALGLHEFEFDGDNGDGRLVSALGSNGEDWGKGNEWAVLKRGRGGLRVRALLLVGDCGRGLAERGGGQERRQPLALRRATTRGEEIMRGLSK